MGVYRKIKPGQPGTKALLARFGRRLVAVRYHYDASRRMAYTTIELIVPGSERFHCPELNVKKRDV